MRGETRTRSGVFELSSAQYSIWVKPTWHYFALFRLLQLSPSYWAVHSVDALGSNPVIFSTMGDAERVREVYRELGEVWETPFWDWWFDRAQYAFGVFHEPHVKLMGRTHDQNEPDAESLRKITDAVTSYFGSNNAVEGRPETLLLAVPVYADRSKILAEISAMIEDVSERRFVAPAKLKIQRRKFRRGTINSAIRVAQARAYYPDLSLSELGKRSQIRAGWASDPKMKNIDPEGVQREFAIYTSRYLRRAWLYSENAARGCFFATDAAPKNAQWPRIDFVSLRGRLDTYADVSRKVYRSLPRDEIASEKRYAGRNRTLFPEDPPL